MDYNLAGVAEFLCTRDVYKCSLVCKTWKINALPIIAERIQTLKWIEENIYNKLIPKSNTTANYFKKIPKLLFTILVYTPYKSVDWMGAIDELSFILSDCDNREYLYLHTTYKYLKNRKMDDIVVKLIAYMHCFSNDNGNFRTSLNTNSSRWLILEREAKMTEKILNLDHSGDSLSLIIRRLIPYYHDPIYRDQLLTEWNSRTLPFYYWNHFPSLYDFHTSPVFHDLPLTTSKVNISTLIPKLMEILQTIPITPQIAISISAFLNRYFYRASNFSWKIFQLHNVSQQLLNILKNPSLWLAWQEALTALIAIRRRTLIEEEITTGLTINFLFGDSENVTQIYKTIQEVLKCRSAKDVSGNYWWPHNLGPHGNAAFVIHTILLLISENNNNTDLHEFECIQRFSFIRLLLESLTSSAKIKDCQSGFESEEQYMESRRMVVDAIRLLFQFLPFSSVREDIIATYTKKNVKEGKEIETIIKPWTEWAISAKKTVGGKQSLKDFIFSVLLLCYQVAEVRELKDFPYSSGKLDKIATFVASCKDATICVLLQKCYLKACGYTKYLARLCKNSPTDIGAITLHAASLNPGSEDWYTSVYLATAAYGKLADYLYIFPIRYKNTTIEIIRQPRISNVDVWKKALSFFMVMFKYNEEIEIYKVHQIASKLGSVLNDSEYEDIKPDIIRFIVTNDWSSSMPAITSERSRWLYYAFDQGLVRAIVRTIRYDSRISTVYIAAYALMWFCSDKDSSRNFMVQMVKDGVVKGATKIFNLGDTEEEIGCKEWMLKILEKLIYITEGRMAIRIEEGLVPILEQIRERKNKSETLLAKRILDMVNDPSVT